MNKSQMMEILEEVKENQRKLKSCARPHDFQEDLTIKQPGLRRLRCITCGGTLDSVAAHYYMQGLADGRAVTS